MKIPYGPTLSSICFTAAVMTRQVGCNLEKCSTLRTKLSKREKPLPWLSSCPMPLQAEGVISMTSITNGGKRISFLRNWCQPWKRNTGSRLKKDSAPLRDFLGEAVEHFSMPCTDRTSVCPLSAAVRSNSFVEFKKGLETNRVVVKDESTLQPYFDRHRAFSRLHSMMLKSWKPLNGILIAAMMISFMKEIAFSISPWRKRKSRMNSGLETVPTTGLIGELLFPICWGSYPILFIRNEVGS